jgi:hypothetical protein
MEIPLHYKENAQGDAVSATANPVLLADTVTSEHYQETLERDFPPHQQLGLIFIGYLKDNMYGNNPHIADKLSEEISSTIIITADNLSRVVTSFPTSTTNGHGCRQFTY